MRLRFGLLTFLIIFLSSCAIYGGYTGKHSRSTSLVQFLYPDGDLPMQDLPNPVINLPLKVGLAFVPASRDLVFSQSYKTQMLEDIKSAFESRVYIDEITVIPEIYLRQESGFNALEQIKRLYSLDVIALVSYDQTTYRDDNVLSLSYLTVVGAYIFPGTSYEVNTLIDLAVIDIESHSILFRSAGTSGGKGATTLVGKNRAFRKKQSGGFEQAMQQMHYNLQVELGKFEQRLRERKPKKKIQVKHRQGYSGGSIPLSLLLLLAMLSLVKKAHARKKY